MGCLTGLDEGLTSSIQQVSINLEESCSIHLMVPNYEKELFKVILVMALISNLQSILFSFLCLYWLTLNNY